MSRVTALPPAEGSIAKPSSYPATIKIRAPRTVRQRFRCGGTHSVTISEKSRRTPRILPCQRYRAPTQVRAGETISSVSRPPSSGSDRLAMSSPTWRMSSRYANTDAGAAGISTVRLSLGTSHPAGAHHAPRHEGADQGKSHTASSSEGDANRWGVDEVGGRSGRTATLKSGGRRAAGRAVGIPAAWAPEPRPGRRGSEGASSRAPRVRP